MVVQDLCGWGRHVEVRSLLGVPEEHAVMDRCVPRVRQDNTRDLLNNVEDQQRQAVSSMVNRLAKMKLK